LVGIQTNAIYIYIYILDETQNITTPFSPLSPPKKKKRKANKEPLTTTKEMTTKRGGKTANRYSTEPK
jgi:hypothetical protein